MINYEILRNQRCRITSDTHPPGNFLKVFRYLEQLDCFSIGSRILQD